MLRHRADGLGPRAESLLKASFRRERLLRRLGVSRLELADPSLALRAALDIQAADAQLPHEQPEAALFETCASFRLAVRRLVTSRLVLECARLASAEAMRVAISAVTAALQERPETAWEAAMRVADAVSFKGELQAAESDVARWETQRATAAEAVERGRGVLKSISVP